LSEKVINVSYKVLKKHSLKECDVKKKKMNKRSYLDDGPGPSKDIVHLNACKNVS